MDEIWLLSAPLIFGGVILVIWILVAGKQSK